MHSLHLCWVVGNKGRVLRGVYHNRGRVVLLLLISRYLLFFAEGSLKLKEVSSVETIFQGISNVLVATSRQEVISLGHRMILLVLLLIYEDYGLFMFFN